MSAPLEVRVAALRELTPLVREFTFAAAQGRLPGFSAGSHVLVHLPFGERTLRNAYSLLGDPAAPRSTTGSPCACRKTRAAARASSTSRCRRATVCSCRRRPTCSPCIPRRATTC